jgi:Glycosyltransferase Family 4
MNTGVLIHDADTAASTHDHQDGSQSREPLRILIVEGALRPDGTVAPASLALANALAEAGQQVCVAAADGPLREHLDPRIKYVHTDNGNHAWAPVAHDLLLYIKLHRFDLVHAFGATCGAVASVAVKASKIPCARVVTHHARAFGRTPRWIAGPVLKRCADYFIAPTAEWEASLEQLGVAPDHVSVIPIRGADETNAARAILDVYRHLVPDKAPSSD